VAAIQRGKAQWGMSGNKRRTEDVLGGLTLEPFTIEDHDMHSILVSRVSHYLQPSSSYLQDRGEVIKTLLIRGHDAVM